MASSTKERPAKLGDLLVEVGLIDGATLGRALALQKMSGDRLPTVLIDKALVDEERYVRALSTRMDLEVVSLATLKVHNQVLSRLPRRLARKHGALPIAVKRANQADYLYVVLSDPCDEAAIDEIIAATGCQLNLLVAPPSELEAAIERYYGSSPPRNASQAPGKSSAAAPPRGGATATGGRPVLTAATAGDSARGSQPPLTRGMVSASAKASGRARVSGNGESARASATTGPRLPPLRLTDEEPGGQTQIELEDLDVGGEADRVPPPARDKTIARAAPLDSDRRETFDPDGEDAALVARVEAEDVEPIEVVEGIATSEVDLHADGVAQALGLTGPPERTATAAADAPETLSAVPRMTRGVAPEALKGDFVTTFELPVDVGDKPSPFDSMTGLNLPTGLERTGIIPVLDWDRGEFEPPPLEGPRSESAHLVGADDIPASPAQVRARLDRPDSGIAPRSEGTDPAGERQNTTRATKQARAAAPADSRAPTLLAGAEIDPDLTAGEPTPRPEPSPRPEPTVASSAPMRVRAEEPEVLEGAEATPAAPSSVIADLAAAPDQALPAEPTSASFRVEDHSRPLHEPQVHDPADTPEAPAESVSDPGAQGLVAALVAGDSLNSSDRAQLLLAVGRLLVKKGVISAEELAEALSD